MMLKFIHLDANYSDDVSGVYQLSCDSDWTLIINRPVSF